MRDRINRAEKRQFRYEDRIRGHLRARHTHLAVNAAIAHLQGELAKIRRYRVSQGERVDAVIAGIIEHIARQVPESYPDSAHYDVPTVLQDLFDRALKDGKIDYIPIPGEIPRELRPLPR